MNTGQRWSGKANPRDLTKTRQQQLLREKQARDEAAGIDVAEVRKTAFREGHSAGYDAGFTAGWDALAAHLVEEGILAPDEQADDAGDE